MTLPYVRGAVSIAVHKWGGTARTARPVRPIPLTREGLAARLSPQADPSTTEEEKAHA